MKPRRELALSALLTILVIFASYILVLSVAAACVLIPLSVTVWFGGPNLYGFMFTVFGAVMAGTMVWSLLPRIDRFSAPGMRLTATDHPKLFEEVEAIASQFGEPLPKEIYLVGETGAWVADRGGWVGIGSRRVMGIGLPLLAVMTLAEFRAVLAHEFSHYYCGDTRLGPRVYGAQEAILRGFRNLQPLDEWVRVPALRAMHALVSTILGFFFTIFIKVKTRTSQKAERRADELAGLVAGSLPMASCLLAIHGVCRAWETYWNTQVMPLLREGRLPPIAAGFVRFAQVPAIASRIESHLTSELSVSESGEEYDSHPSLRSRIVAVERLAVPAPNEATEPAISVLNNLARTEDAFVRGIPGMQIPSLIPIEWEETGKLWSDSWRSEMEPYSELLAGLVFETLPSALKRLDDLGRWIKDPPGMLLSRKQRADMAQQLLATACAVALQDHGWELHASPGDMSLVRGEHQLRIFSAVSQLHSGALQVDAWLDQCREMGISAIPLSKAAQS